MRISQAIYRGRQFWLAWRTPSLTDEELAPARSILTAKQLQLFARLQPSEQIHALRVLQTVQQYGETDQDLQTAALLHDIGKVRAPLNLRERVIIVFGKAFFGDRVKIWGHGQPQGWVRPFVVVEQHPAWGGELASEVGTSPLAVSLIRKHQSIGEISSTFTQENHLLSILQKADQIN